MEQSATQNAKDEELLQDAAGSEDAIEDDGTPVLDEQDLEENGLTEEEADNIEWEEPQ